VWLSSAMRTRDAPLLLEVAARLDDSAAAAAQRDGRRGAIVSLGARGGKRVDSIREALSSFGGFGEKSFVGVVSVSPGFANWSNVVELLGRTGSFGLGLEKKSGGLRALPGSTGSWGRRFYGWRGRPPAPPFKPEARGLGSSPAILSQR
jgi:hypothetical protein